MLMALHGFLFLVFCSAVITGSRVRGWRKQEMKDRKCPNQMWSLSFSFYFSLQDVLGDEERRLMDYVPALAVRLMKRRVLSRPGVLSSAGPGLVVITCWLWISDWPETSCRNTSKRPIAGMSSLLAVISIFLFIVPSGLFLRYRNSFLLFFGFIFYELDIIRFFFHLFQMLIFQWGSKR